MTSSSLSSHCSLQLSKLDQICMSVDIQVYVIDGGTWVDASMLFYTADHESQGAPFRKLTCEAGRADPPLEKQNKCGRLDQCQGVRQQGRRPISPT